MLPSAEKKKSRCAESSPPPVDSPDGAKEDTTPLEELFQAGCANYKSFDELFEDAEIEVSRLEELRYCTKVTKEQAKEWWDEGTIAKMAIIVKENQEGPREQPIIIDERPAYIVTDAHDRWQYGEANLCKDIEPSELSFISGDWSDAHFHFQAREDEWKHCLTPSLDPEFILVWIHMCLGLKGAPLMWCRFAAALARMIQGTLKPSEARMQLYLDDPIWTVLARGTRLVFITAMVTMLLLALGVRVSWKKCAKGKEIQWIGVVFELRLMSAELALTITERLMRDIREECDAMMSSAVVGLRHTERLAGKLSWAAGVAPRSRWAASCLYAAVAAATRDVTDGTEDRRRAKRQDSRRKDHKLK